MLLLLACSAAFLRAADPAPPASLFVDLRCLTLPRAVAVPLVRRLRAGQDGDRTAALAELDGLLARGGAKLIAWPSLTVRWPGEMLSGGEKASQREMEEIRFAKSVEPPTELLTHRDVPGEAKPDAENVRVTTEASAADFAMREVGVALEIQTLWTNRPDLISLHLVAQHVRLVSLDHLVLEHQYTTEKRVEKIIQEQPRFQTLKVDDSMTFRSGVPEIIGLFRVPGSAEEIELFILTATIAP